MPPSAEILRARLTGRKTDAPEVIERRLAEAAAECRNAPEFDFLVVNDDFETATKELLSIFLARRLRMEAQLKRHGRTLKAIADGA